MPPSLCSPPLNTCDPVTAASSPYTTEAFSPPRKQVLCVHTLKGRERLGKGTRGRDTQRRQVALKPTLSWRRK